MAGPNPKGSGKVPGSGRKKGTPNKVNALLKDQILQALDELGGVAYLVKLAKENPTAFSALLGRILRHRSLARTTAPCKSLWPKPLEAQTG